jgi:two-component system, chemotaxis family, sensor kinase Cph1
VEGGITSIGKHAGAKRVGVILKTSPQDVAMIIEDDGSGFELETLNGVTSPRLGLLGARGRLAPVHGGLEIETKPGEGTTLIVRVPLDDCAAGR